MVCRIDRHGRRGYTATPSDTMSKQQPVIPPACGRATALPFGRDTPWLAPLAGYSDLPFRLLCRHYGAACCVTEMVSAKGLLYQSAGTGRLLLGAPDDQPCIVQLFGAEADCLGEATRQLVATGYAWFDLNMGCSVHKVLRQGAGAAMLADTTNALAVARAMLAAAGPGHVGFKLRLGVDAEHPVLPDLALRLQDLGAGWLSLHPRTARQGFSGEADWEAIARLKEMLSIPLVASGDLFTAADGLRCLETTGADTVMYARGAIRNPAIFREHGLLLSGGQVPAQTPQALYELLLRHMRLVEAHREVVHNPVGKMRGLLAGYVRSLPGARSVREALCRCDSWQGLHDVLRLAFGDASGLLVTLEG